MTRAVGAGTVVPKAAARPDPGREDLPGSTIPRTTGEFRGHYAVPVPPDLADASSFAMSDVDWTVSGSTATLHYDLPVGLVGGALSITLSGPLIS